jgi:hypothetical protein
MTVAVSSFKVLKELSATVKKKTNSLRLAIYSSPGEALYRNREGCENKRVRKTRVSDGPLLSAH